MGASDHILGHNPLDPSGNSCPSPEDHVTRFLVGGIEKMRKKRGKVSDLVHLWILSFALILTFDTHMAIPIRALPGQVGNAASKLLALCREKGLWTEEPNPPTQLLCLHHHPQITLL